LEPKKVGLDIGPVLLWSGHYSKILLYYVSVFL